MVTSLVAYPVTKFRITLYNFLLLSELDVVLGAIVAWRCICCAANIFHVCQTEVVKWHEANAAATCWVCVGKQQCSDFNVECTVCDVAGQPSVKEFRYSVG